MKIIDNIIFCDTYEKELLLLKLIIESPVVDEFVISECHYTYRGDYKGSKLQEIFDNDVRFAKFKDKVTIISISENLSDSNPILKKERDPKAYHFAEVRLRNAGTGHILNKYNDNDYIFVSDVDEIIDFSNIQRKERIISYLEHNCSYQFERLRYWWDFDNRTWREPLDMITPAFPVKDIRSGKASLDNKKWVGKPIPLGNEPLIFEYTFCFPYESVLQKYETSLHTQWIKEKIDDSINCNHWTMTSYQNINLQSRYHWFEKVELTTKNSPQYIIDNLYSLKTNLIPNNYKENRIKKYGISPSFKENVDII